MVLASFRESITAAVRHQHRSATPWRPVASEADQIGVSGMQCRGDAEGPLLTRSEASHLVLRSIDLDVQTLEAGCRIGDQHAGLGGLDVGEGLRLLISCHRGDHRITERWERSE